MVPQTTFDSQDTYRLALLLGQHLREVFGMLLQCIGKLKDGLLALLVRDLGPLLEGRLASIDGIVDIFLS